MEYMQISTVAHFTRLKGDDMKRHIIGCIVVLLLLSGCGVTRFGIAPIPSNEMPAVTAEPIHLEHTLQAFHVPEATKYNLNYSIELRIVDPTNGQVLIVGNNEEKKLKEKPVFLFEPESGKIIWALKSTAPNFYVYFTKELPDKVILKGSQKAVAVSRDNGSTLWERDGGFAPLSYKDHLAYSVIRYGADIELQAFDMQTGQNKWLRGPFVCGWWGFHWHMLDEQSRLLAGDGLNRFDLSSGEGWSYRVDTDAVGGTGRVIAGAILSALTGAYAGGAADRYENLTSNALIIDDTVYYAGNRVLARVDLNSGKAKWEIKLPKIAAHSALYEDGNRIVLIGLGWCHKNGRVTDYSIPYIALFDKKDGKQLAYKLLGPEKRMTCWHFADQNGYFVAAGVLHYIDTTHPEDVVVMEKAQMSETYGSLLSFVDNPESYFEMNMSGDDGLFKRLAEDKTTEQDRWLHTSNGMVLVNKSLKIIKFVPKKEIYRLLSEKNDIGLIRCIDEKADKRWVRFIDLQNQGRLIGEIKTALPISIVEDQLFFWDHNSVIVQPLQKISELQ